MCTISWPSIGGGRNYRVRRFRVFPGLGRNDRFSSILGLEVEGDGGIKVRRNRDILG